MVMNAPPLACHGHADMLLRCIKFFAPSTGVSSLVSKATVCDCISIAVLATMLRKILPTLIIVSAMSLQIAEPEGYKKKGSTQQPKQAFANGTALPAKRPRTSNTADPDASRRNKSFPAITDFCSSTALQATNSGRHVASDTPGPESLVDAQIKRQVEQLEQSKMESDILDTLQPPTTYPAILANAASQVEQASIVPSDQRHHSKQPAKHAVVSAEKKRQIMADAATRRLAPQQHEPASVDAQHAAPEVPTGVSKPSLLPAHMNNPSTTHKGSSQPATHAGAPGGFDTKTRSDLAHMSAIIDLIDDEDEPEPKGAQLQSERSFHSTLGYQEPCCPICGQTWSKQMSNAVINIHIDQCLRVQLS